MSCVRYRAYCLSLFAVRFIAGEKVYDPKFSEELNLLSATYNSSEPYGAPTKHGSLNS